MLLYSDFQVDIKFLLLTSIFVSVRVYLGHDEDLQAPVALKFFRRKFINIDNVSSQFAF